VYLEEQVVGPSLGADSIRQGLVAGLAGLAIVIVCMLAYYKKAGLNATLALLLNSLILLAALAYLEAVLTLPGIAGIILGIGMAVDSNVLIFERIREELRAGKSAVAAVNAGFNKAFLTIIDTHVTTVVSCAFLFLFGTGPVKGFAVTLVIGLLANVFTAVFVSRFIFDLEFAGKRQVARLSI
jgi:preprotein translocase subunit SecD